MSYLTHKYTWLFCGGLTSLIIAILLIPVIIEFTKSRNLLDEPDHRKEHQSPIPTLGGIAIFVSILISSLLWLKVELLYELRFILLSVSLLFVIGIWDDLKDLSAGKKFIIQIVATLVVASSGIRIESLQGLFGVFELHPIWQYTLTVLLMVGITNAVNLIDGIDGLAGGVVAINAFIFAMLFALKGNLTFALLSICLCGALVGFLYYNFNPAKIFMGDTGSLVIGFLLAVMAIKYLQLDQLKDGTTLTIVFGILILPVFDTLRVFGVRILKGNSPFSPDRNHIHHLLGKTGYNHKQSALIMYAANIIIISTAFYIGFSNLSIITSLVLIIALTTLLSEILSIKRALKASLIVSNLIQNRKRKETHNHLLIKLDHEK